MSDVKGSCLCGDIAFTLGGELSGMSHCHCSMCRKIHGSAFATYFNAEELRWDKGEKLAVSYESSVGFKRSFCSQCGSVLPHHSNHHDNWCVAAGLLNDDPGIRSTEHIFAESKAPWFDMGEGIREIHEYGDDDDSPVIIRADDSGLAGDGYKGGACACGKVAYRFQNNAEFMMYCHCTRCRKVKGAAHATNAFVKPEMFEWTKGEDNLTVYDLPGAVRFGNSFCKDCGSSMPRKAENAPAFNVPAGSLDDAPGCVVKGHIFVGSMAPWYVITDSLPQHNEMPG